MAASLDSGIPPFRKAIYNLVKELSEENVNDLKFLWTTCVPKAKMENISALELFDSLEKCGKISENNYKFLEEALELIQREDLKKKFKQDMKPESGLSPSVPTNNAPPSPAFMRDIGHDLKPPSNYMHPSSPNVPQVKPGIFEGIPKRERSQSHEATSSVDPNLSAKRMYSVDSKVKNPSELDPPLDTLASVSGSGSPQGQDFLLQKSSEPSVNSKRSGISPKELSTSVHQASRSGYGQQDSASKTKGENVEGLMGHMSLQDSAEAERASTVYDLPDDVETDSPFRVSSSFSLRGQGGNSTSHLVGTPEIDSGGRGQQQREARQAPDMSSPHDSQGSATLPSLDLSSDSPDGAGQVREEQQPHDKPLDEMVRAAERLMDEQEARKTARRAGQPRPVLREYQKELAARPLEEFENYIICAPTGSGKTLTAAFICYQYWTWFQRKVSHKHFKALFIVNMRHLTLQQRDAFQKYFPTKEAVRTIGEQETFTEALKIDEEMPAVLMLTAQIFVNALKSKAIDIKEIDMLIFDECHHTDLKHPYNEIMKMYLKKKQVLPRPPPVGVSGVALPFVIGLSASLGVGGEAHSHLLTLCGNMDAKGVVRVLENAEELHHHVNTPAEDSMKVVDPRPDSDREFGRLLEDIMDEIENQLPEIENHPLPYCGSQIYEGETMKRLTEAQKKGDRTAIIVYMYLYEYNRALMLYDDLRVKDGLRHLEKFHGSRLICANQEQIPTEEDCRRLFDSNLRRMKRLSDTEDEHSNQKLGELAHLLHEIFTEKPDSKGIVLARMKVATTALCDFIKNSTLLQILPQRVVPLRFVGQGDIEDDCLTEGEQKRVLKGFKGDGGNVLVATDIAQEGLDMPACNFVIRYNFVSNEIGTVQSKGRARAEGSQCYLIVESGSLNERRELENRYKVKKMEEAMEELEAMTEGDRLRKITERQREILEKMRRADEEAERQQAMHNLDRIIVQCKECSALVCKASELRRKGDAGHVTCISPQFKKWVKEVRYRRPTQRFRDTETVGLISCGTEDCGQQFGTIQNFLQFDPPDGYALKAQSFKVCFENGIIKTLKQWKKAGFQILVDERR